MFLLSEHGLSFVAAADYREAKKKYDLDHPCDDKSGAKGSVLSSSAGEPSRAKVPTTLAIAAIRNCHDSESDRHIGI